MYDGVCLNKSKKKDCAEFSVCSDMVGEDVCDFKRLDHVCK